MRRNRRETEVHVVTDAGRSRRQEIDNRQRNYIIKMGIRTLCLILAIVLFTLGVPFPYLLVLIVASTVLPWMSVVVANSGPAPDPRRRPASFYTPDSRRGLGAAPDDRPR